MPTGPVVFAEEFDGTELDLGVWLPHYLPAWSSLEASRATWDQRGSALVLSIPPEQGLWCPDDHRPPIRVSGIQTGNHSGPAGSTIGQQPFRPGLTVREPQVTFRGWLPRPPIRIDIEARVAVTGRSMAGAWLAGFEDVPARSAELCVLEVFGRDVVPGHSAAVGTGIKPFRDPAAVEAFGTAELAIDVAEPHVYSVDWTREEARFLVDDDVVRTCPRPPTYPMQLMLAIFDFPEWSNGNDDGAVPELVVESVRGTA
jgi:hypothetical protein